MRGEEILFESPHRRPRGVLLRLTRMDAPTLAAGNGFVAALVHAVVVREHLAHWWGYGAFFAVVAAAQAAAAIALYRRPTRRVLIAVAASDVALLVLYALSRSLGTPFFGPHAGITEPVAPIDLLANAAEVLQLAAALTALRLGAAPRQARGARPVAIGALVALAAAAFAAPVGAVHQATPAPVFLTAVSEPTLDPHALHTVEPTAEPIVEEPPPPELPYTPCTPRVGAGSELGSGVGSRAPAVVYPYQGDLWLAAPADGTVRRLTTDGHECSESFPAFRDADTIAFAADGTIYDLELRTGTLRRVVEVRGGISTFAWNPDGTAVAYMSWGLEDEPPALSIYTPATGDTRRVRAFPSGGGRCGSMDDESSVSWSADGRSLIVVATVLDFDGNTMFVVTADGKDIVPPRIGTHARWTPDPDTIVYREFVEPRRWFSLDLRSGGRTALPMQTATHHAAVSPDGRYIAYSDEAERPSLYLYDVARRAERVLIRGYAAPIWLSATELAASKTKSCEDCMGHGMWTDAGETAAFAVTGEATRPLSVRSTLEAAVFPAPAPSPSPTPEPPTPTPSPTSSPTPSEPTPSVPLPEPTESPTPEPTPSPSSTSVTTGATRSPSR